MKRAVVLLSGGLDSATTLALAASEGYTCYALSFSYGQKHDVELAAAKKIARSQNVVEHRVMTIDLGAFGGSALTDADIVVPEAPGDGIPITYVPARNTVFLSLALAWSEVLEAQHIFLGVNAVDYSGYPDCRPEFIAAFQDMAALATRAGVEGEGVQIHAPLMSMGKDDIVKLGMRLGVDYSVTVSCYQPDTAGAACGKCDSCRLRAQGFANAGLDDPTVYA